MMSLPSQALSTTFAPNTSTKMTQQTVVKLRGELTPPESWQDAGFTPSQHVWVDDVEEVGDDAYRLAADGVSEPWHLSRENVVAVRPPGHPGHPENLL